MLRGSSTTSHYPSPIPSPRQQLMSYCSYPFSLYTWGVSRVSANTCVKPLHIFYRHFLRNGLILGFDYLLKDFASISSNITVPSQPRHIDVEHYLSLVNQRPSKGRDASRQPSTPSADHPFNSHFMAYICQAWQLYSWSVWSVWSSICCRVGA